MNKDKRFVIIFLVIIYSVLLLYPVNYVLIKKGIFVNSYATFVQDDSESHNIFEKINNKLNYYKNYLDVMVTNNFPFYSEINLYTRKFINFLDEKEYKLFGQNSLVLIKNVENEYVVKNFEDKFFYRIYNKSDAFLKESLTKQISIMQKLASYDVPVYIYLPYRYELTSNDNISFRDFSKYQDEFKNKLSDFIQIKELNLDKDDYLKSFYHTDHHLNSYGAKKTLQDLSSLLNVSLNDYEVKEVNGIEMMGSMAKSSGDNTYHDKLLYLDTPYELKISNNNYKKLEVTKHKDLFYDYYVGFYNGSTSEVLSYDYGNGNDNLLIIGDSFVWQMDYIIAESFNKTYTVYPRYVENFNYKEFIKENNITKVLVLMEAPSTLFDIYNYDLEERLGL